MTDGANRLADFLRTHDLTQLSAATALGVSDPTIHDWVSGAKRPKAHHREAIAVWTRGAVPAESWLADSEREAMAAVRPFRPARRAS